MNGLRSWIARRLLVGALQTAAVVLLVFALTEALPGDAAVAFAGDQPDPQRIAAVREAMGLDRPAHERLADWVRGLLHGDFGTSLTSGRPVAGFLADGFAPPWSSPRSRSCSWSRRAWAWACSPPATKDGSPTG